MGSIVSIWRTMPTAERFAAVTFPPALLTIGTLLAVVLG